VYIAAEDGHADVLALLLEANANPSAARTDGGATPVYMAAWKGHADVLALLLEANADPSAATTDTGTTPVYMAAWKGHADVLALLLEANANPSAAETNSFGYTPLIVAAQQGKSLEVVRALLDAGADPRQASRDGHWTSWLVPGWTPLTMAETNGHTAIATLLTQYLKAAHGRTPSHPAAVDVGGGKFALACAVVVVAAFATRRSWLPR
jgi:ankyrin repeat protein